ncbi:MAG: pyrroline-5-carboxylate reductase [Lentihominibacter sp.]|jgi:pyrroline-5-carboxylate reductase
MKIGFIGTGNMGGAILWGYAKSSAATGNTILIHNRTTERNEEMAKAIRKAVQSEPTIEICNDNLILSQRSDIVIVGVKPMDVPGVLEEIKGCGKLIISMAAGVSLTSMETVLGPDVRLIRIMPNTPAQVGEAMTAMTRNGNVSAEDFAAAKMIFDAVGKTEEVDEELMDCVVGVSGSSPAYTYMYINALIGAAEEEGMSPDKARIFAAQSVLGAAKMVLENRESPEQLRINVSSPGGTTIEAVKVLQANGFEEKIKEGFRAAVARSREMTEE